MTKQDKVLKHLKKYGTITTEQARTKYGVGRVAYMITRLRRRGYDIKKHFFIADKHCYVQYRLKKHNIWTKISEKIKGK